jgi:membrane associated rhomboid family serine protease
VSVRARLLPLAETLGLMLVVTLVGWVVGPAAFALTDAAVARPWTLATSVYAHGDLVHLCSNAVVVALAGVPVALTTSRVRFHAFFLGTGALAGLAEILTGAVGVVGASGAAFALVGYALAANPVADVVGDRLDLSARAAVAAVGVVALLVALVFGGAGGALLGHFVGALVGLVAGAERLLAVATRTER